MSLLIEVAHLLKRIEGIIDASTAEVKPEGVIWDFRVGLVSTKLS